MLESNVGLTPHRSSPVSAEHELNAWFMQATPRRFAMPETEVRAPHPWNQ